MKFKAGDRVVYTPMFMDSSWGDTGVVVRYYLENAYPEQGKRLLVKWSNGDSMHVLESNVTNQNMFNPGEDVIERMAAFLRLAGYEVIKKNDS